MLDATDEKWPIKVNRLCDVTGIDFPRFSMGFLYHHAFRMEENMRRPLRIPALVTVGAIITALLLACSTPVSSPYRAKLRIGIMPIVDASPFFVAQDQGYFSAEGLEVQAVRMAGGAVIAPAVESGDLDIGFSNTVSIAAAKNQGFDFVFLTPGAFNVRRPGTQEVGCMMVPSGSAITSAAELSGKLVAVNTRGNISELIVDVWVERNGLSPTQIRLSEVPYPSMEAALSSNQIDAALVWEPFVSRALQNKAARTLDCNPMGMMADQVLISSWFAKSSWISAHSAETNQFAAAIRRAIAYTQAHPDNTRQIVARETGTDEALAQRVVLPSFLTNWRMQDLQVVLDLATHYGLLTRPIKASDIVAEGADAHD